MREICLQYFIRNLHFEFLLKDLLSFSCILIYTKVQFIFIVIVTCKKIIILFTCNEIMVEGYKMEALFAAGNVKCILLQVNRDLFPLNWL